MVSVVKEMLKLTQTVGAVLHGMEKFLISPETMQRAPWEPEERSRINSNHSYKLMLAAFPEEARLSENRMES